MTEYRRSLIWSDRWETSHRWPSAESHWFEATGEVTVTWNQTVWKTGCRIAGRLFLRANKCSPLFHTSSASAAWQVSMVSECKTYELLPMHQTPAQIQWWNQLTTVNWHMCLNSLDSLHSPQHQKTLFGYRCSIMPSAWTHAYIHQSLCDVIKQQLSCVMGSVHEQVCKDG